MWPRVELGAEVPDQVAMALTEQRFPGLVEAWLRPVLERLSVGLPVVLKCGATSSDATLSQLLAVRLAEAMCRMFVDSSGLRELAVEVEPLLRAKIHSGYSTRDMLPHHDAHHTSYLSPSLCDVGDWNPAWREFSQPASVPTRKVSLYSGFVVLDPGVDESVTTFFDWVEIVRDAYARAYPWDAEPAAPVVARWLGDNIRRSIHLSKDLGIEYLSLGAALGATRRSFHVSAVEAECAFSEGLYERVPELHELSISCPCGTCDGVPKRLLCWQLRESLGLTYPEFQDRYALKVRSGRHDFLFWNNIRLQHGAVGGAFGRTLLPISLSIDQARGESFEGWLAEQWRTRPQTVDTLLDQRRLALTPTALPGE